MGIKQYIFLGIMFIFLVGIGVYALDGATYTLTMFSKDLTFPVAFWFMVPVIVLFLATIFHLLYYSIKRYFEKKVIKKDYETFLQNIKDCIINEEHTHEYRTEYFKNLSEIIKKLTYNKQSDGEKIEPKFLNDTFELLQKIYSGEYTDIKKLKLRNDNPLTLQNRQNILNCDNKTFLDTFKHCKSTDDEFCQKAYEKFTEIATFSEVKKQNFQLSSKTAIKIFKRYANEESYTLSNEDIKYILEKIEFTSDEYLEIAKILKQKVDPSSLLSIFESIQANNHLAANAYLYILFEFQMINEAREFLENSEENEYEKFKILLFLRDSGKNTNTDLII
ncbi:MAG: hypothetical protein LBG67_03470 [Campylobacteraceae bacterium]|jgi:hypothetical protein|nr:hypothetical protein [Campylobacteraceae bacterium]